jgi:hypothetical protein
MKRFPTVLFSLALAALAGAQTTKPAPFIISAWQVPPEDVPKWQGRGVNTFYEAVDFGGRMSKAEWERQVADKGGFFITRPGEDIAAEAKQPYRVGFNQLDEVDLSSHVDKPGYTIADFKGQADRVRATGLPMYMTLAAFDNEWYDGHPKPGKTDASKYGHRAADGGWMAYADVIGWDFYLWTLNRGGRFDVWKRLMDRSSDWSGGKPQLVFVETCTQGKAGADGKPLPYTADQFESEVNTVLAYCIQKGYKIGGIVYFSHNVFPKWTSFDGTSPEVALRMSILNGRMQIQYGKPAPRPVVIPPPPPVNDELVKQLEAAKAALAQAQRDTAAAKSALTESETVRVKAAAQAAALAETLKAAQPSPATQPTGPGVFVIPPEPGNPARPYNYGHPSISWPWTYAMADITRAQVMGYAAACRDGDPAFMPRKADGQPGQTTTVVIAGGAPCCLDYENFFRDGVTAEKIALVRKHLDWFYAVYPDADLALVGVPQWANDETTTKALATLHNRCRSIVTGAYAYRRADWDARQAGVVRGLIAEARGHYPDKRFQCWLMPYRMDNDDQGRPLPMPPDLGRDVWAVAAGEMNRPGDSVVVFGGTWAEKVGAYGELLK